MVKIKVKDLSRKIGAVVLTGIFASSVGFASSNVGATSAVVDSVNYINGGTDFDSEFGVEDVFVISDFAKNLSQEDLKKVEELDKKIAKLNEKYYELSVKHKKDFEKIDDKMALLFEKQVKLGFDAKDSDYEKLDKEIEKVSKEYEALEKKIGVDKINSQIKDLNMKIDKIYGFDEKSFEFKELSEDELKEVEKLEKELDEKFKKYEKDFEKIHKEYDEKLKKLEKDSGILDLQKKINKIYGFDEDVEGVYFGSGMMLEEFAEGEVFDSLGEVSNANFNKLKKLEDTYGFEDEMEYLEIVEASNVEFEENGMDFTWSSIRNVFR